jgi:hypothetical protein
MPYEAPSVARRGYLFRRLTHLLGCQLLELVIGEHRKQRGDRVDGQLAHPAYASVGAKSRGVCELFRRKLKQNAAAPGGVERRPIKIAWSLNSSDERGRDMISVIASLSETPGEY